MKKLFILASGLLLGVAAPLIAASEELMKAVKAKDLDLVKAAFAKSLSEQQIANLVNFQDKSGIGGSINSPLKEAVNKGRRDIVEFLLSKGANAKFKDSIQTVLHIAANRGRKDIAELLLAHGADINAPDWEMITPLMGAALNGHLDMVKFLVSKGANLKARDKAGDDVLEYAEDSENQQLIDYLEPLVAQANKPRVTGGAA